LHFAMQRRNWKQLLKDRTLRKLIPYISGYFIICPVSAYIVLEYYGKGVAYVPNTGPLWFLGEYLSLCSVASSVVEISENTSVKYYIEVFQGNAQPTVWYFYDGFTYYG